MSTDHLENKHRDMYHVTDIMRYGLGMCTPRLDPKRIEFGWGGDEDYNSNITY